MNMLSLQIGFWPNRHRDGWADEVSLPGIVPMDSLFACPESGLFFPAYEAKVDVAPPPFVDARAFYCPVCDSRLTIGAPSSSVPSRSAIAKCRSCSWSTDGSRYEALPDLLSCEKNPYVLLEGAFQRTLKSLSQGADCDAGAFGKYLYPVTYPVEKSNAESAEFKLVSSARGNVGMNASSPERGGADIAVSECCFSSDTLNFLCPEQAAMPAMERFSGALLIADFLPLCERFSANGWEREKMPPRRHVGKLSLIMQSPYAVESARAISASMNVQQRSPVKATTFMPRIEVTQRQSDSRRLVVSISNSLSIPLTISLELLHQQSAASTNHQHASLANESAAQLSPGDLSRDFVIQLEDALSGQLDVLITARVVAPVGTGSNRPAIEHWLLNRDWTCRMVIAREVRPQSIQCLC
jgi:hypothetical protein